MLRRHVRRLGGHSNVRVCRSDIDDRAAPDVAGPGSGFHGAGFLRCHCFGHGADAEQDPFDVDIHDVFEIGDRAVGYGDVGLFGDLVVERSEFSKTSTVGSG